MICLHNISNWISKRITCFFHQLFLFTSTTLSFHTLFIFCDLAWKVPSLFFSFNSFHFDSLFSPFPFTSLIIHFSLCLSLLKAPTEADFSFFSRNLLPKIRRKSRRERGSREFFYLAQMLFNLSVFLSTDFRECEWDSNGKSILLPCILQNGNGEKTNKIFMRQFCLYTLFGIFDPVYQF